MSRRSSAYDLAQEIIDAASPISEYYSEVIRDNMEKYGEPELAAYEAFLDAKNRNHKMKRALLEKAEAVWSGIFFPGTTRQFEPILVD